jgi:regulator of cell morphogenesis and NO signaling
MSQTNDPQTMTTPELVAHVVTSHHQNLRTALPFLGPLSAKVARVHGEHDPRLIEVHHTFAQMADTLEAHLDLEERVLFRLADAAAGGESPGADRAEIERALDGARGDHSDLGVALRHIRELTRDFAAPDWACTSYRRLLTELRTLEENLLHHVRVENEILFPRL